MSPYAYYWLLKRHARWPQRGTSYSVEGVEVPRSHPPRRIGFRFDQADRRDDLLPIQRLYEGTR